MIQEQVNQVEIVGGAAAGMEFNGSGGPAGLPDNEEEQGDRRVSVYFTDGQSESSQ